LMSTLARVIVGTIIHSKSFSEIEILRNSIIGVATDGTISFVNNKDSLDCLKKDWDSSVEIVEVKEPKFIVPGFIDSHIHAPQYSFTGTGYDLPLLDWLNKYTFPAETQLSNTELATNVYSDVIKRTLENGTTTASYYATIDLKATQVLVQLLYKAGQRALVGKVNMDINSPEDYVETTEKSFEETENFLKFTVDEFAVQQQKNISAAQVLPILTPRFVPSCSGTLLQKLGELAKEGWHVQSHISENKAEIAWVKSLHPELGNYTEIYHHYGLLTEKTIMGHGVYLADEELKLFQKQGAGISHCPISNFALRSGVFNTRRAVDFGVKVGLGTDVSGGYSPCMLEVMRQAIIASTVIYFGDDKYQPLSFKEAFFLATQGNAELLGMADKIGTITQGKFLDALVIDPACPESPFNSYDFVANSIEDIFQKFIFLGNKQNIESVFVQGQKKI